jgi:hypothetical protein
MAGSKDNIPKNIMGRADTSEDEIDLIDYFRVLWKRKYFILLFAVLPALIVLSIFIFLPKDYKITYIYDTWLDKELPKAFYGGFESMKSVRTKDLRQLQSQSEDGPSERNHRILLDSFYRNDNLGKLAAKLRENGFDEFAQEISKTQIQLESSNALLTLTIVGGPEQDMLRISSIVRDYFERVVPTYILREDLSDTIAGLGIEMANIKENNFGLEFELERKSAILKRMKNLRPPDPNKIPGGIILPINEISQDSKYLPLAYQIQATDVNIIDIEETIRANQQKYNYYNNLMSLTEKLFEEIKTKMSSYYTVQEFHLFLASMTNDYTEKQLTDYLDAYTRRIENVMFASTPVIEEPDVHPVPKGAVRKSAVSFVGFLMIASFAAFFLEAIQQRQTPTS